MVEVHDTLLTAHIPQLADVVISCTGPQVCTARADCRSPDIVRMTIKSEVLLAYCDIPPPYLDTIMPPVFSLLPNKLAKYSVELHTA